MLRRFIGGIDLVATSAILTALLFWSIGPVCIKYISGFLDSWTQNALRYSIGAFFWLPYLILAAKRSIITTVAWRRALVPALCNILMQSFWAGTLYYLSATQASFLNKTSVLFVALFSMIAFTDERRLLKSRRFWLSLFLCFAGVAGVIFSKADYDSSQNITGALLACGNAVSWALYAVSVRFYMRDVDSRSSFAVISLYTALGLTALMLLLGKPSEILTMAASGWVAVVVSAILCISLAHVLFYVAIKRVGATLPAIVLLSTPFTVLAIAWFWFGDRLSLGQWIFGLLLICGASLAILAQADLRKKDVCVKNYYTEND